MKLMLLFFLWPTNMYEIDTVALILKSLETSVLVYAKCTLFVNVSRDVLSHADNQTKLVLVDFT